MLKACVALDSLPVSNTAPIYDRNTAIYVHSYPAWRGMRASNTKRLHILSAHHLLAKIWGINLDFPTNVPLIWGIFLSFHLLDSLPPGIPSQSNGTNSTAVIKRWNSPLKLHSRREMKVWGWKTCNSQLTFLKRPMWLLLCCKVKHIIHNVFHRM